MLVLLHRVRNLLLVGVGLVVVIVSIGACGSDGVALGDVEEEEDFVMRATAITFHDTPPPTYVQEAEDCELERGVSCPGVDISGMDLGAIHEKRHTARHAVDLRDADFTGAIAVDTNLKQARLDGAVFHDANLKSVNLEGASLENAELHRANLEDAIMHSASLYQADFTGANLKGVVLDYVDAEEAIFDGADLTGATLIGANLVNTNLTGANLTGADLTEAEIEGTILDGVIFCQTIMPDGSTKDTDCPD